MEEVRVLEEADPMKQEPLSCEVELDPMEGEQTWPTVEEEERGVLVEAALLSGTPICVCSYSKTEGRGGERRGRLPFFLD